MYSPLIVDRKLAALRRAGHAITPRSIDESLAITSKLTKLVDATGKPSRPWSKSEIDFMRSEVALSRIDFRYFANRYGYCNTPDAPIWMADASFKRLSDVRVGDEVMGWEKANTRVVQRGGAGGHFKQKQKLVVARVLRLQHRSALVIEVVMASGRKLKCTRDHLWSNGTHRRFWEPWTRAEVGATLRYFVTPQFGLPKRLSEREAGWLGGIFDGEGSCHTLGTVQIAQSESHNPQIVGEIIRLLELAGVPYSRGDDKFHTTGGREQLVRFLNIARPIRADKILARIMGYCDSQLDCVSRVRVLGDMEVISLQTTTGNYVAWGYASKNCELDATVGSGVSPITFWASQVRTLELIAAREEEIYREYSKHGFSDGLLVVWHKCRQEGATALGRLISAHRMLLNRNVRAMVATLDDSKVHEIYLRDKVILDNLPFFLKPEVEYDVKDYHIGLAVLKSRLSYQKANQEAGIGTGSQYDVSHLTEVALWAYPDRIKLDFLPTIPQSPDIFVGFESTAFGRSNFWHEFTEHVRRRDYGFGTWIYSFTPWYIEPGKYRRAAPDGWVPNPHTYAHAEMVERTSAEFCGKTIRPTRDQLYWWETEREFYRKDGTLNIFLTNFCATPEESFQHSTPSALPIETLEWMRTTALMGMPYSIETGRRVET